MDKNEKIKHKGIPSNAKKVFGGVIFDVYQWEQEMFDGSVEIFEKLKRPDTTNVIAFTEDEKVIVLEQEQPGKGKFLSLPGGRAEENENPEEGARREFLEETGYAANSFELWHSSQLISKIDWQIYFFIAKGCKKIADQKLDSGERIKIKIVELEEFAELIFSGKIKASEIIMKLFEEALIVIDAEKTVDKLRTHFGS